MRRSLLGLKHVETAPELDDEELEPSNYIPERPFWAQPMFPSITYGGNEGIEHDFLGYVDGAYKRNGIVFTCILVRGNVFSEARFQFRRLTNGRPGDLFGTQSLGILETPWKNGTTGQLLWRMEQDASLAGNFFGLRMRDGTRSWIKRLPPHQVTIISGSQSANAPRDALDAELVGYMYTSTEGETTLLPYDRVAHFAPIPDPASTHRGMSWLSPVVAEVLSDSAATRHKQRFFENGAMPSTVITYDKSVSATKLAEFAAAYRESHAGSRNAYKTLHLAGGAQLESYGADLKQLDFKNIQGSIETRIAAASGVGAIVAQFSEGMAGSSLNAGNYSAARRRFADMTMRPAWRAASAALAPLVDVPAGAELWFDDRDIPFLQEDRKDAAEIQGRQATTIRTLVEGGFEPESVKAAVLSEDMSLLSHTNRLSVQLQDVSGDPGAPKEYTPEDLARAIQQTYLAANVTMTPEEIRDVLNRFGAGLSGRLPPNEGPTP